MTDIVKDIEDVAAAGLDLRTKLIVALGACILIGLALLGLANHFEAKGRTLERAGWLAKEVQERADDLALEQKHQADMAALEKTHQAIERKTSEDHQTEVAKLHAAAAADRADADRRGGLRIPAPACPAGSPVAGTEAASAGGRDDASASTVRLPEQVENNLWAIADDADEVSAQLRACQSWIRANGFYGPALSESKQLLDRMVSSQNFDNEAENAASR